MVHGHSNTSLGEGYYGRCITGFSGSLGGAKRSMLDHRQSTMPSTRQYFPNKISSAAAFLTIRVNSVHRQPGKLYTVHSHSMRHMEGSHAAAIITTLRLCYAPPPSAWGCITVSVKCKFTKSAAVPVPRNLQCAVPGTLHSAVQPDRHCKENMGGL